MFSVKMETIREDEEFIPENQQPEPIEEEDDDADWSGYNDASSSDQLFRAKVLRKKKKIALAKAHKRKQMKKTLSKANPLRWVCTSPACKSIFFQRTQLVTHIQQFHPERNNPASMALLKPSCLKPQKCRKFRDRGDYYPGPLDVKKRQAKLEKLRTEIEVERLGKKIEKL